MIAFGLIIIRWGKEDVEVINHKWENKKGIVFSLIFICFDHMEGDCRRYVYNDSVLTTLKWSPKCNSGAITSAVGMTFSLRTFSG